VHLGKESEDRAIRKWNSTCWKSSLQRRTAAGWQKNRKYDQDSIVASEGPLPFAAPKPAIISVEVYFVI
jgi:hypothetical protein